MAVNKEIPVQLHPTMPMEQLVAFINQNFTTISNQLNTYIISDGTNNRIVIGKQTDGTYAIVVSKEGYDVLEALSDG